MREIDKLHFCWGNNLYDNGYCDLTGLQCCKQCCKQCGYYHCKYPTPKQFKKEYGYEWKGAVYCRDTTDKKWCTVSYLYAMTHRWLVSGLEIIICACTPFGAPPDDWRPE